MIQERKTGNSVTNDSDSTENSMASKSYIVCAYRIIQNWLTEYKCIQIHIRAKFLPVDKIHIRIIYSRKIYYMDINLWLLIALRKVEGQVFRALTFGQKLNEHRLDLS